jgi:predicted DNA-binding protein
MKEKKKFDYKVDVRFTIDHIKWLNKWSKKLKTTRSEIIRDLITAQIELK